MPFELHFHNCSNEFEVSIREFCGEWTKGLSAIEVKTSGSTGVPKTITHQRKTVEASALRTNTFFKLTEKSVVLSALDAKTIGGKMVLIRALVGKYSVHFTTPSRNPFLTIPVELSFDFCSLVPLQFRTILQDNPAYLNRIHTILLGGSSISTQEEKQFLAAHSSIFIGFGMTETVSHFALRQLGCEPYECLKGATINALEGHLTLNDKTLKINKLETTDLIKPLSHTKFIWLGRSDFAINSGGIKIHPEQLEKSIAHSIDSPFVIIGLPHASFGEQVVFVSEEKIDVQLENQINIQIEQLFGKYAVPKRYLVHSIPMTTSMKPMRKVLIDLLKASND